jgi:hypothetical protein
MLHWDEWSREQGLTEEDYAELSTEVETHAALLGPALARGDVKRGGFLTYLTLQRHGITLPKDSPSYRKLTFALLKAAVKANDGRRDRQAGKVVETPKAPVGTHKGPTRAQSVTGNRRQRRSARQRRNHWRSS